MLRHLKHFKARSTLLRRPPGRSNLSSYRSYAAKVASSRSQQSPFSGQMKRKWYRVSCYHSAFPKTFADGDDSRHCTTANLTTVETGTSQRFLEGNTQMPCPTVLTSVIAPRVTWEMGLWGLPWLHSGAGRPYCCGWHRARLGGWRADTKGGMQQRAVPFPSWLQTRH